MARPFQITSLDDIVEWKNAFLAVGIERSRPLLQPAGVPPAMASAPDRLQDHARQFLIAAEALATEVKSPPLDQPVAMRAELLTEPYAAGIERLLSATFDDLARDYGEGAASELAAWAERHFVDPHERNRWWLWSILLPRLANAYGHGGPVTPSPLAPEDQTAFETAVRQWFGPDVVAFDANRIASARAIPLSPLERRLVALEVLEPDDPSEVDVVNALELALGEERAYQTWLRLKETLKRTPRRHLVNWAAKEAAAMQIPRDLIAQLVIPLASTS